MMLISEMHVSGASVVLFHSQMKQVAIWMSLET